MKNIIVQVSLVKILLMGILILGCSNTRLTTSKMEGKYDKLEDVYILMNGDLKFLTNLMPKLETEFKKRGVKTQTFINKGEKAKDNLSLTPNAELISDIRKFDSRYLLEITYGGGWDRYKFKIDLIDFNTKNIVWTANVETFIDNWDFGNIRSISDFSEKLFKELESAQLVTAPAPDSVVLENDSIHVSSAKILFVEGVLKNGNYSITGQIKNVGKKPISTLVVDFTLSEKNGTEIFTETGVKIESKNGLKNGAIKYFKIEFKAPDKIWEKRPDYKIQSIGFTKR